MGNGRAPLTGFGKPELKRLSAELIAKCAELFAQRFGMDSRPALKQAKRLVKEARKALEGQPLMHEPPRRGKRRLEQLRKSAAGIQQFQALQRDGVREADFIAWWDHHALERETIRRLDAFEQAHLLDQLTARRLSMVEAQSRIRSQMPVFGNGKTSAALGPHVPLPYELRARVLAYLSRADPIEVRRGTERCISLNAYLRERIQEGDL